MQITQNAIAGTLESSDVQVVIEPAEGLEISVASSVMSQYGRQIRQTVLSTLNDLHVNDAWVTITDKGALDCTIKARVQCAVYRAAGIDGDYPWGDAIK